MSVLKNKSYKDYSYVSRYSNTPFYYHSYDNKYVSGVASNLDTSTPYRMHTVKNGDTFDSLALEYYNNPTLYWIICAFNNIANPYQELEIGSKIKIPSYSTLSFDSNGRF